MIRNVFFKDHSLTELRNLYRMTLKHRLDDFYQVTQHSGVIFARVCIVFAA